MEYVGVHFEKGSYVAEAIENKAIPQFQKPEPVETDAKDSSGNDIKIVSEIDKMIWSKEVDYYVKQKALLNDNMRKLYSLVWGQCSQVMCEKLEAKWIHWRF